MKKDDLRRILDSLGIEKLNDMQEVALETIEKDNEVMLLSPTGSGKTLAYLLPILGHLDPKEKWVQCVVIVPTRELGLQIEQVWRKMDTGFKVNMCYGGHSLETEMNNLSNPPALLIGTPGRLRDHLERRSFKTAAVKTLVLDEFDKSLQLGFHEQMEYIIAEMGKIQRRVLVSATSDIDIPEFTGVKEPTVLNFVVEGDYSVNIETKLVISEDKDKLQTLFRLLCSLGTEQSIIFTNHRESAERISEFLSSEGIICAHYHGGMEQEPRERALIKFRNGTAQHLVATDLAARGLDIPDIKHVIHYHLPLKEDEFVHRNGRTARMMTAGTIYVIHHEDEKRAHYMDYDSEVFTPDSEAKLPTAPIYQTIYVSGGKKNKINKVDIVGFFTQKGKIEKADIGLIEVKDFVSFVAVKSDKVRSLLQNIKEEKMKGAKYKIQIAR